MPTSPSVATTRPGGILAPRYRRSLIAISRAPTLTMMRERTISTTIKTANPISNVGRRETKSMFSIQPTFQSRGTSRLYVHRIFKLATQVCEAAFQHEAGGRIPGAGGEHPKLAVEQSS